MPPTFHIASLKRYTPKFSGPAQKLTWCQWFGVQVLPKLGNSCTKSIFLAKRSIFAYSIPYIFWKLLLQRLIWHIWGPAMCILWPVRFFVTLWESTGSISWNLVVKNSSQCIICMLLKASHSASCLSIFHKVCPHQKDFLRGLTMPFILSVTCHQYVKTKLLKGWKLKLSS